MADPAPAQPAHRIVRVRLATQLEVPDRRGINNQPPERFPFLTEYPREYDFEPAAGDTILAGPHGLWRFTVTGRRVGLDGILIADGELDAERHVGHRYNAFDYLLRNGWMPDMGASLHESFSEFIPAEPVNDPVELARIVTSRIVAVQQGYGMWSSTFDGVVRYWADLRGIEPAAAA